MGKIIIQSSTGAKLYLNDKELDTIKAEVKEFEIENGTHELRAKSAWCGSQKVKINVNEGESVTLLLYSFKYEGVIKAVFMLLVALFMMTKQIAILFFAGALFLYPLYYITIAKDQYLQLIKVEQNTVNE